MNCRLVKYHDLGLSVSPCSLPTRQSSLIFCILVDASPEGGSLSYLCLHHWQVEGHTAYMVFFCSSMFFHYFLPLQARQKTHSYVCA